MSDRTKEYLWVLAVSILILAFSSLPLVTGYAVQTPDQQFIGTFFDRPDYAVHLAAMQYGGQGHWDYQLRFTSEPDITTYLKTFYVFLGHLARWTGLGNATVYQIARVLFGLLALLAIYRLLRRVFPSLPARRLAFILAVFGSGLGWLELLIGWSPSRITPIDFWLIDAYLLFSIAIFPHFSAVIAAMAIAVAAFLDESRQPHWRHLLVIGICALFVQMVNPIAFLLPDLAMAGIFAFSCWQKGRFDLRLLLALGLVAAIQMPLLVYSLLLFMRDPLWAIFNRQNVTASPSPVYYLFGFGLFWPFAIAGMVRILRERDVNQSWALVWTVAAFGLAYLPIGTQRRFLLAVTLPLAVLATPVLLDFSHWLHRRFQMGERSGAVLLVVLTSMGSLLLIGNYTFGMKSQPSTLFEPAALVQAVDWLAAHGSPQEVVLASEPTSQLVGMRTPLRLYAGHEMETINYVEKSQSVEEYYNGDSPTGWLESQAITWVIFGPHEPAWQPGLTPAETAEIAYQDGQVRIYHLVAQK